MEVFDENKVLLRKNYTSTKIRLIENDCEVEHRKVNNSKNNLNFGIFM